MREFRTSDFLHPLHLARAYLLLRRSEHWTQSQFDQYQGKMLARLLRHCANNVSHYGVMFDRLGLEMDELSPDNAMAFLRKLPILDRDTLRENHQQFIARNARRFRPRAQRTSGSTGTPVTVLWDRGSNVMELCAMQRLWRWVGFRIGQPFLDINSNPLSGIEKRGVIDGDVRYIRTWQINALEFSSDFIDETNVERYYEVLLRYKPRLVRGHPLAIQTLCDLIQRKGLTRWRPVAVAGKAETLYDFQRRQIGETWDVPVVESYGLIEHNVFIGQCPAGGYHVFPEYGICEIVDDDGNPTPPGEEGRIIATGLHNYAQPLLRYDTGDVAVSGDGEACPCGRTLPTISRLVGRLEDCLVSSDGKRFTGMRYAFRDRRGLKKARLVQEDFERITVELEVTSEFDRSERAALMDALQSRLGRYFVFDVRIVYRIVQETPGKFKFVVSKVESP